MSEAYQQDELYAVVTRFNINVKYTKVTTKLLDEINPAVDEGYLSRRFELFETYTVPSIQNQLAQNFIWVVLFHQDTPQKYKDKIMALQQAYPAFHPLFVPHTTDYIALTNQYLLSFGAKRYIMARIDNDDAFHESFMQQVQAVVQNDPRTEYLILFANGLQYHEKQRFATRYHFPLNHFSAFVTPNKGDGTLNNVLSYNHTMVDKLFEIEMVQNEQPMWLELVHESNVSNRMQVKRQHIVRKIEELDGFGDHYALSAYAARIAVVYALLKKPINAVRLYKMYGMKGVVGKIKEKLNR